MTLSISELIDALGALFVNFYSLSLESAPFLVLGLVIAGLIKAWVPTESVAKQLGGSGIWPITKAALIGAPLPLCSCSVIPVTLGIHRSGASKGATVSFLVATPETGADSIAISYALLGPFMAIIRPISAISSAIFAGLIVSFSKDKRGGVSEVSHSGAVGTGACCESKEEEKQSCCSSDDHSSVKAEPVTPGVVNNAMHKTLSGLRYAFTDIFNNMIFWLCIGLFFAAMVKTFVPVSFLQQWGSGFGAMIVMVIVGVPMYICATASTPMAAGFLLAGLSPGTVLVFLLAGPATNMATLAIVKKELGSYALFAYLCGIVVAAIGFGLLVDQLVVLWDINILAQVDGTHEMVNPWLEGVTGLLLLILALRYGFGVIKKRTYA
ncbi:hypothetical protein A9Q81_04310 [Gammaproteobacteria bacterium 42_54_T18]|nr:hypothetical protein A9Q81_04310 [Gammaproteobacteria bacterium 42_54_T18]